MGERATANLASAFGLSRLLPQVEKEGFCINP